MFFFSVRTEREFEGIKVVAQVGKSTLLPCLTPQPLDVNDSSETMSYKANVSCCCLKMTMISRRGDANRDTIKTCTLEICKALAVIL